MINMGLINITRGTDHVLLLTLTRGGAPMAVSACSRLTATARNAFGRSMELTRRASAQDEGVVEVDWPSSLSAGTYTLDVEGELEGEGRWRCAGVGVQVTNTTSCDAESVTVDGDAYDVVMTVTVRRGRHGVDEELRERVAEIIDEEYNASELVRETNEDARKTAETARDSAETARAAAEALRDSTEAARESAEAARSTAETERQTAEIARSNSETARSQTETERQTAEIARSNSETARSQTETERQTAEIARSNSETARATAETERQTAEVVRSNSEAARLQAETARLTAEAARETAEVKRQTDTDKAISDAEAATASATTAAQNANTKAALADEKATLADQKATLAQQKAMLADEKAALADQKATLANTAAQSADTAREELMAKEVTMDDFDEILPPPTGVDPDYEVVKVLLTDGIGGLNLQGLPVSIYLNGSTTAAETKTADANGCIIFTLPVGTHYRLAFTQVTGAEEMADEEHTALLIWRAVERTYKEQEEGEEVTVTLRREGSAYEPIVDAVVTVVYGNRAITQQTDAQGTVKVSVPLGTVYGVVAPEVTGLYARQNRYTQRFTASETRRNVYFTYSEYEVGVFILATDGAQFDLIGWQEAVAQGTRQNSEAVAIKVSTASLVQNGGVFALDIDMLASGTRMPSNKSWASSTSYAFTSVPANGNSSTAAYYYDGYTASRNIQQEGDEKNISTPAVDACLGLTLAVGEETLPGFLGSVGQWTAAWNNVSVIDQIIAAVRPESTGRLSSRTSAKWTCTQNNANNAWSWAASATNGSRSSSCTVVPFFAY